MLMKTQVRKIMNVISKIITAHCGYCVVGTQPDYE